MISRWFLQVILFLLSELGRNVVIEIVKHSDDDSRNDRGSDKPTVNFT